MFGTKSAPPDPSPMADVIDGGPGIKSLSDAACRRSHQMHRCKHCRFLFDPAEEAAIIRKHWCSRCEVDWIEGKLNAMVDRLGRRASLAAFRRLTR